MTLSHVGKINHAFARHINGANTAVELVIYYSMTERDGDGEFVSNRTIDIPLRTSLRQAGAIARKLENKFVAVNVSIEGVES